MSDLLIFIVLLLRPLKFPSGRGSCKIDQAYLTLDVFLSSKAAVQRCS